jgi:very-short-patch-repair endonuclease
VRPALAVVHSVATAPTDRAGEWRLAAAVQQRLVLPSELRTVLGALPDVVRSRLIASVLDDVELGAHAASELEFLRFLRRHGLPEPDALQRPVRAGGLRYLDAWWERQRVAAEIDGVHHRDAWTWDADLLRANAVQVGQRHDRAVLLRFSVSNLRHDEAEVVRQLSLVLS